MFERHKRALAFVLLLSDVVLINIAFLLAYLSRYEWELYAALDEVNYVPFSEYVPVAALLTVVLLVVYKWEGVYNQRRGASWFDEVMTLLKGTLIGVAILIFFVFLYRPYFYSRLTFGYAGILIVVILSAARAVERAIRDRLRQRGIGVDRIVIVGAGEVGRAIMRNIVAQPELGYHVVGFVDDDPEKQKTDIGRFKALGNVERLPEILATQSVDQVVVALPWTSHRTIMGIVEQCEQRRVSAKIVPDLFQLSLDRVALDDINGIPLLGVRETTIRGWNLLVKRAIDLVLGSLIVVLLAPLLTLIVILIRLDSPGPALFRQTRVGRGGRFFTAYKFRSMRVGGEQELGDLASLNEATGPIFKMRRDPRRTRVGQWLRRLSLDELPQLYNVLRGEMSLVGPRPPLPTEVAQYQDWHKKRLEVSPGMSGLWQVSGRSELTFDEMVMLDIYYAENWSLGLDFKILLRTIPTIISGRGAY